MSTSTRRAIGLAAAIAAVVVITGYCGWRMEVASRRGWMGMSYIVPIGKLTSQSAIGGLQPGAIFMVYPGAPADRLGLQRGDVILAINGIAANNMRALITLNNAAKDGDTIRYRYSRNGEIKEVQGPLDSPMSSPMFVTSFVASMAVAITFLVIGAFVFWRRPVDSRATLFYTMTLVAAIAFANASLLQVDAAKMRGIGVSESVGNLWRFIGIGAAGVFFTPLLLHLALLFPKERPVMQRRRRQTLLWIYGFPTTFLLYGALHLALLSGLEHGVLITPKVIIGVVVATAALSVAALIVSIIRRGPREGLVHSAIAANWLVMSIYAGALLLVGRAAMHSKSIMPLFMATLVIVVVIALTFAVYAAATFVALFRSYRESGVEERRQVKWPLWATMVAVAGKIVLSLMGFAVLFFTLGHGVLATFLFALPDILSKLLYVLIPLSFAFAILKYRLMNIDVVIRRTVLYSILTFVVFALYAVVVAGVGTALVKFAGLTNSTMLVASTVIVAMAAVPIRNRLQRMVDRNLFREKRDYPLALRNIGNAIGGGSVDEFLRLSAEQIQQALQNRLVVIAVRREQEFVAAAKVGVADEIIGRLRVRDDDDGALRKIGATLIVPVRKVALLALGSKLSDEEFNADDREFLGAAAAQIAIGVENVRLRVEEVEFEQARAMQQILLPTRFPELNGFEISGMWHPARSVGGDYFDTLTLGANQAAICIGDVAGKGMSAALLMANLQAAVKATASASAEPATVCERVKEIVGGNLQGGKFISFFYGLLDAQSRTFKYSNAGHNPPILVRANGDVERLDRGGPAMCRLFRDIPQEQGATRLAPGDRIVLFTDGATEARRGEEDFGDDRLIQLILDHPHLHAHELQERIMSELRDFAGGDFGDDVTLVVVVAH